MLLSLVRGDGEHHLFYLKNSSVSVTRIISPRDLRNMTSRPASHAGSWYTASPTKLSAELDEWLAMVGNTPQKDKNGEVEDMLKGITLPIPRARLIIAPYVLPYFEITGLFGLTFDSHAGYAYSGKAAAYAYKCLDLSKAKRIFLLGPSHTYHLPGCALSSHSCYETPFGNLKLDRDTINKLMSSKKFDKIEPYFERKEHSLEMHLPYIYKMLSQSFGTAAEFPLLIPILVGHTNSHADRTYGKILAPYLSDPTSVFIVSSDFCHWGIESFQYGYYLSTSQSGTTGRKLRIGDKRPTNPPIHESIKQLDQMSMDAIESGKHKEFLETQKNTGNTVCGQHPIAVIMAALEKLDEEAKISDKEDKIPDEEGKHGKGKVSDEEGEESEDDNGKVSNGASIRFKFVRYDRSCLVVDVKESSVSYASAFAVFPNVSP